ncbi:MAG: universal stress protein, partial [Bacteroidia bacterium]
KRNIIKPIESDVILVALDLTDLSEITTSHAAKLASLFNKKVHLVNIYEKGGKSLSKFSSIDERTTELKRLTEKFKEINKVEIDFSIQEGSIYETIADIATKMNASLIIMGTHGVTGMQKFTGSKALKVITSADRPFVVMDKSALVCDEYKNILLPVDYAFESKQKIAWALELGKRFDSVCHLLVKHEKNELDNSVINNLRYLERELKSESVNYIVHDVPATEDFTDATIKYALENKVDMIMVMVSLETTFTAWLNGGPYEQKIIANGQGVPVMVLNSFDPMLFSAGATGILGSH